MQRHGRQVDAAPRSGRRRRVGIGCLLVLLLGVALLWQPAVTHLDAAGLLLRFEGREPSAGGLAGFGHHAVSTSERTLGSGRHGVRARRYVPEGGKRAPGVMLVHGVHPEGIDEPRLREFARVLASSGVQVWTPEIDSLARYRIAPQAIDAIGKAAESAAEALDQRAVGVMGISFSGGLALMAAAREAHAPSMAFVVAVGAHHDLRRVARWYAGRTIEGPEGRAPPVEPHPYGAGVIIHNQLGAFFPERDLELARKALERALAGNRSAAREYLPRLSPSGRRQLRRILNRRGDGALAATLLEVIDEHSGQLASVSPAGSLGGLRVPVFLVHGTGDPVVPSVETRWLARAVPDAHLEQAVVTPFLRHAEQQRKPTWRQRLRLVHFMAEVIEAARDTD